MRRTGIAFASTAIAAMLAGCLGSAGSGEDEAQDKADDIAGIEENSFEEFGVLNAAASLDEAGWKKEIGVSAKVAKKLVAAQSDDSFGLTGVFSIEELVAIGDLSPEAIEKLLALAKDRDLVPTAAIRIPVMNQDGTFLFKLNGQMKKQGLGFFRKFMFLWEGDAGIAQYVHYDRLGDDAVEKDIDADPSTGAGLIAGDGAGTLCHVGDVEKVVDAASAGISTVWSEQLQVFGWRGGDEVVLIDEVEEADLLDLLSTSERKAWKEFDTEGTEVIIASTTSDGGDDPSLDFIDACE